MAIRNVDGKTPICSKKTTNYQIAMEETGKGAVRIFLKDEAGRKVSTQRRHAAV